MTPQTARSADRQVHDPAQALAEAEDLVGQGRHVEAIDLLTRCNRVARDAQVERRLVVLRSDAFSVIDRSAQREVWPPEVPDLFPDVAGIPEIEPADLDAQTLASGVLHHGALLIRGLIPRTWVDRIVEDIDRAFAGRARFADEGSELAADGAFLPFERGDKVLLSGDRLVRTVDSPHTLFDLLEVFAEVGVTQAISEYLGERPSLSARKSTLRRIPADSVSGDWHQDGAFLGEGARTVNVWLALSAAGVDAPGLDVVPFRLDEVVQTGTDGAWFDWSVGPDLVERLVADEGRSVERPLVEPGDVMLFDELNLHRTGVSPGMTNDRYAVETWFFASSTYPKEQEPLIV
jgi:hypothetical protein